MIVDRIAKFYDSMVQFASFGALKIMFVDGIISVNFTHVSLNCIDNYVVTNMKCPLKKKEKNNTR